LKEMDLDAGRRITPRSRMQNIGTQIFVPNGLPIRRTTSAFNADGASRYE